MKFSCCINYNTSVLLKHLEILHKHGYTGYETSLMHLVNASDEEIASVAAKASTLGMECVSLNGMFPGDIPLLGGGEEYSRVSEYLHKAFEKARPLGSKTVVLGSGGARKIPDGMSYELAKERFIAVISDVIAPIAKRYGYTVVIEELRVESCNFINSCKEAMEIVRAVNVPEVQLLIDYYHAVLGGDTLEEMAGYGSAIKHVHIASPKHDRSFPIHDDLEDCRGFFAALRSAGYDGAVSLEGYYKGDFESAIAESIAVMNEALNV